MKKILLALSVVSLANCFNATAQTVNAGSTDFSSATTPALPSGWASSPAGWQTSSTPTNLYFETVNPETKGGKYAVINDYNGGTAHVPHFQNVRLTSPVFSLSGVTNPYLKFDYLINGAYYGGTLDTENIYLDISTNGGSSWTTLCGLKPFGAWATYGQDLSAYAGMSNLEFAFRYTDDDTSLIGAAIANVRVFSYWPNDVTITNIDGAQNNIAGNGGSLPFTFTNNGSSTVTSIVATYSINGGTPVSQTFSGLSLPSFAGTQLVFTTALSGMTSGANNITVNITQVNGGADAYPGDNSMTQAVTFASTASARNGLIEEFSSSTCNPCRYFNWCVDTLMVNRHADQPPSHYNEIKYQMNWPDWNDDHSYNQDGLDRRTYYNVNGVPDHFVNGTETSIPLQLPVSNTTPYTDEMQNSYALNSYIDMAATYTVDTNAKQLSIGITVTPHFTSTGTYHVYIAACDAYYQNVQNEWGQIDYYHVERQMFPNGNGTAVTSFTDGSAQNFTFNNKPYTVGNWKVAAPFYSFSSTSGPNYSGPSSDTSSTYYPQMMSNTFWYNPYLNSEVIAFVEDDATHNILQSVALPASAFVLNVSTASGVQGSSIYPNPAKEATTLEFDLTQSGNVNIQVLDLEGRVVSNVANENMSSGNHKIKISTADIAPGNYIVSIKTSGGVAAKSLTITR